MTFLNSLVRPQKRGIRMDFLWFWVVLMACAFFVSLVPQSPNDLWWHLRIGKIIYETWHVPETNQFSWILPESTPFMYGAWLAEWFFYVLYRFGGVKLILFARTLMLVLTLLLVGNVARSRSGSWRLAALAVGIAFAMTLNNLIARPQNFSWVCFALIYAALDRYRTLPYEMGYLLSLCGSVMVLWVNSHGAFVLGPVLVSLYAVGSMCDYVFLGKRSEALFEVRDYGLVLLVVLLAMMINPMGPGILYYVADLMTDASSQQLIVEWQSPTPEGIANTVFFASVGVWLLVLWLDRDQDSFVDLFVVLSFLGLAWTGQRYVVWYALTAMPIWAGRLSKVIGRWEWLVSPEQNLLNALLAIVLVIPVIAVQPWFVHNWHDVLPTSYWALVRTDSSAGPLLSTDTPVDVIDYLTENPCSHMFNEMGYGSYFIWALPGQKVFVDPRVELYPYEIWRDYQRISQGIRYHSLLKQYEVDRLILDSEGQRELITSLREDARWRRVYIDASTQVWDLTNLQ